MSDSASFEHLVFEISAPLASWGDIAVGEMRPSADRPTRSCLLGLLAACLGFRRNSESELRALDALRLAVRVTESGLPLNDYHTIQVPKTARGVAYRTRRDELSWNLRSDLGTILSTRAYRMEIQAHVIVHRPVDAEDNCPTLDRIAAAMNHPSFIPYLGRRSCPLAKPFSPRILSAPDFVSAYEGSLTDLAARDSAPARDASLPAPPDARWFWEDGCHSPFSPHRTHHRYDRCTSHEHRLFSDRIEYEAIIRAQ